MPLIPKKDLRILWVSLALGVGFTCAIGLIAGNGTLLKSSVAALVIGGVLSFCSGAYFLGWLNSYTYAIPIIAIVCLVMCCLGYEVLPGPPIIEISKEFRLASIDIAPGVDADIGWFKDDFTVNFQLCENTGKDFINWVGKPHQGESPGTMYLYHVFNHSSYSVSNLRASFTAKFLGGESGVTVLGSKTFDVYIKNIPTGNSYSFYMVNMSHFSVEVDSPDTMEVQVPGQDKTRVPILKGKLIMGTFPISDIASEKGELDLPLIGSVRNWDSAGCHN